MIEATATDSGGVGKGIKIELTKNKKKMRLPLAPKNIRRLTIFGWKKSPKYDEWMYKITP